MSIFVATNGKIVINGVDLSDHCKSFKFNDGVETREATAINNNMRTFRNGLFNVSLEATFHNDPAVSSIEPTLRGLNVGATSTGFPVLCQKVAGSSAGIPTSSSNPSYTFTGIIDGDLGLLGIDVGELDEITVRFLPYTGTLTVTTSSS